MKRLNILRALLLTSCATNGNLSNYITAKYQGETEYYNINAQERFIDGRCIDRIITLKEKNMLHTNPNHVDYVQAIDTHCDDIIDNLRFRSLQMRSIDRTILEQDILNGFYRIKYGSFK